MAHTFFAKISQKGATLKYGYVRVSSVDQNVARQADALLSAGIESDNIFIDKRSGKDFNRPAWKRLMRKLKCGDLLVVLSLDRLGRNYGEILEVWRKITKQKNANIKVLDMEILDTTNKSNGLIGTLITDIVLSLLSYVAETERRNIRERQREGIEAAKRRGVKFGQPRIGQAEEIAKCIEQIDKGILSVESAAETCRVSRTTIRRRMVQLRQNMV